MVVGFRPRTLTKRLGLERTVAQFPVRVPRIKDGQYLWSLHVLGVDGWESSRGRTRYS